jgi:hypothetical protein
MSKDRGKSKDAPWRAAVKNPTDHGDETVRPLRREVLSETHAREDWLRIRRDDFASAQPGEEREQDGDKPAYDVCVAVAAKNAGSPFGDRSRRSTLA